MAEQELQGTSPRDELRGDWLRSALRCAAIGRGALRLFCLFGVPEVPTESRSGCYGYTWMSAQPQALRLAQVIQLSTELCSTARMNQARRSKNWPPLETRGADAPVCERQAFLGRSHAETLHGARWTAAHSSHSPFCGEQHLEDREDGAQQPMFSSRAGPDPSARHKRAREGGSAPPRSLCALQH
ncbi:PREDICTED: uncharacterized protein LOC102011313 isoform X6 [Chinchilla lanigera]|uniref:uncharacterized protein LOC102011313 isoform X6 n=1 Tax=Chinchilla lanigera TaxID=34839 RepID=UPI0006971E22|nr:PREDICTED: uncharacterized protein LOC102011313 isoform X6 [Chinchilla lanigera]